MASFALGADRRSVATERCSPPRVLQKPSRSRPTGCNPLLDAYASFLNGLAYPIQVLVRALPIDLASYARRLEDRAADLPPTLAASARADAVWARQTGPGSGCSTDAPFWCCRRRRCLTGT